MEANIKKAVLGFIYGLIFGFASPIPGVSAGTMAILLNVYDRFFSAFSWSFIKENLLAVIAFLAGWGAGLLGISNIMMFLFDNHEQLVSFAFIGLIMGCLPIIYKKATDGKPEMKNSVIFLLAFGIMAILAFFGGDLASNSTIEQMGGMTPIVLVWLFFASFISSIAILIPGVGGSLVMIALGIYTVYLEAVSTLNIVVLAVFVVSMILGVFVGIIVTKKLLASFAKSLYAAISGFIIGSLLIIYPGFSFNLEGLLAVLLAGICFAFAYKLSKKG
jgi:putative membrane protein